MDCFWQGLKGKKTYLVAGSAMLAIFMAWQGGKIEKEKAIEDAVGVVLAMTIRHGLSTEAETDEEEAEDLSKNLPSDVKDDINRLTNFMAQAKNAAPPKAPPAAK